ATGDVGVTADPQALAGGEHVEDADTTGAAWVPGEGQAGQRIKSGDAFPGDRARSGTVGRVGVVGPAEVTPGVHRVIGDLNSVGGVTAGPVHPGRLLVGTVGDVLPAGLGVAQPLDAAVAAGGRDDEVGPVGREV